MKKICMILVAAAIAGSSLVAQNSRVEVISINGKEKEKTAEKASEKPYFRANPTMDGKTYMKDKNGKVIFYDEKNLRYTENEQQKTLNNSYVKPSVREFKSSIRMKKSERDDVATITLKTGDPIYLFGPVGFQMLLDADAKLYDFFEDIYLSNRQYLSCEYKIPENASFNLNNTIIEGDGSVNVPEGVYDFVFFYIYEFFGSPNVNIAKWADSKSFFTDALGFPRGMHSITDNFFFKAGYEYVFQLNDPEWNMIECYPEYNANFSNIILPLPSTELTAQEEVTVIIKNNGLQDIVSNVQLSFKINDSDWTAPETLSVSLEMDEEFTYTFNTNADFSENGFYTVVAHIEYDMDLYPENNYITGYTKKIGPVNLPFIDYFDSKESLWNYTIIDANNNLQSWNYDFNNEDAFGSNGLLQVNSDEYYADYDWRADEYLITDPMVLPEAGTYNISFFAKSNYTENLRILYGTSSELEDMNLLEDLKVQTDQFEVFIKNFQIQTPGIYYFAFHYYSFEPDNSMCLYFDNLKISAGEFEGNPDISVRGLGPIFSCEMKDQSTIGAEIKNRGSAPITSFTLSYQVEGENPVSQTFNESVFVNFTETVDFSEIGEYWVKFSSSTPNEINTSNNNANIIVRHYPPVTELPFITIFSNPQEVYYWNPAETKGWQTRFGLCYSDMFNVPLLSKCITLDPDIYIFRFNYLAGVNFEDIGIYYQDFYVTYGKSGTDPLSWEPVKEYHEFTNYQQTDDFFMINITEGGEYQIAFVALPPENEIITFPVLALSSTNLEIAKEHDILLTNVTTELARITPKNQIEGEQTFTATLQNIGKTSTESGNIKMFLDDNEIISQDFSFAEIGETLNVNIKPTLGLLSIGEINLKFTASISNGINKDLEMLKIVSDSTFAFDNVDEGFFNVAGFYAGTPAGMGLIYEIQNVDILTSINIGFAEYEDYSNKEIILAVYKMNGEMVLGDKILEVQRPRTIGNFFESVNFDIPDTELQPGKYFFELRQLDDDNYYVSFDFDSEGYVIIYSPQDDEFEKIFDYGYIHLRPNFGKNVGISTDKMPANQLTFYPNPTRGELRVENGELKMDRITVYNATGQVVMSVSNVNASSCSINTEKLSAGLYFISVQTKDGVVNEKFVVK